VGGLGLVHSLYRAHREVVPARARLLLLTLPTFQSYSTLCQVLKSRLWGTVGTGESPSCHPIKSIKAENLKIHLIYTHIYSCLSTDCRLTSLSVSFSNSSSRSIVSSTYGMNLSAWCSNISFNILSTIVRTLPYITTEGQHQNHADRLTESCDYYICVAQLTVIGAG